MQLGGIFATSLVAMDLSSRTSLAAAWSSYPTNLDPMVDRVDLKRTVKRLVTIACQKSDFSSKRADDEGMNRISRDVDTSTHRSTLAVLVVRLIDVALFVVDEASVDLLVHCLQTNNLLAQAK